MGNELIQEEANRKRAEAARKQELRGNRYVAPKKEKSLEEPAQPVQEPVKKDVGDKTRQAKAMASKTNRGTKVKKSVPILY